MFALGWLTIRSSIPTEAPGPTEPPRYAMKFTENAVEKAAADHGTVASPSSLNRARYGYPQHYQREEEHGVRFPGQLPPNFNGSYTSMFGNYRPHTTSEPAPRPAAVRVPANPYAAGSHTSRRFQEQVNRQESSAPIASTAVPDHASASAAAAYGNGPGTRFVVQPPDMHHHPPTPCYAPKNAAAGSAPTTTAGAGPDDALSQGMNGMSFDTYPPPRIAHVAGAYHHRPPSPRYAPADVVPRIPHPQEMSMTGFDRLPLETREAMAAAAGVSIAGLEEMMRVTHAEDESRRDAEYAHSRAHHDAKPGAVPDSSEPPAFGGVGDVEENTEPQAQVDLEEKPLPAFGGAGDADPDDVCLPVADRRKVKNFLFKGVKHLVCRVITCLLAVSGTLSHPCF